MSDKTPYLEMAARLGHPTGLLVLADNLMEKAEKLEKLIAEDEKLNFLNSLYKEISVLASPEQEEAAELETELTKELPELEELLEKTRKLGDCHFRCVKTS